MKHLTAWMCIIFLMGGHAPLAWAELGALRESRSEQHDRQGSSYLPDTAPKERREGWYRTADEHAQFARFVSGSTRKLSRGLVNFMTAPFELILSIDKSRREKGWGKAGTYGIVRGVGRVMGRTGTAILDTATFPVLPNADPLMSPEFTLGDSGEGSEE